MKKNIAVSKSHKPAPAPVLSDTQQRILAFIREYTLTHGYAPSIREIGDDLCIGSTSSVKYQLDKLVELGYIRKGARVSRGIAIVSDAEREGVSNGTMHDICFCFSRATRREDRSSINHVQGSNEKTLCGIGYGQGWDFEYGDLSTFNFCKRCKRIMESQAQIGEVSE